MMATIAVAHVVGVVVFFYGTTKIHRRKQGKYVSLQQRDKQLQEVHEYGKCYTYRPNSQALKYKN